MSTQTITVTGMTCQHCVASVTEELTEVPGITGVEVDLVEGGDSTVRITADGDVDPQAVQAAVTEAGYTVRA